MAKQRMVNTRFWDDDYTSNLDPIEKLLFLYFLTNTSTNICGVYEIPIKKIANETGIDKEMVLKIIGRFTKDLKIFYKDGWAVVRNFIKHQNQRSPKVQKGIEIELLNVPESVRDLLELKGIDTLSHSNTNSNTNSNSNSNNSHSQKSSKKKIEKEIFGELENVKLTNEEYQKLIEKFGDKNTNILIFELDTYIGSKGDKYKSHYATLLSWAKRKWEEQENKKISKNNNIAFT
jgi:hypothetical protein